MVRHARRYADEEEAKVQKQARIQVDVLKQKRKRKLLGSARELAREMRGNGTGGRIIEETEDGAKFLDN